MRAEKIRVGIIEKNIVIRERFVEIINSEEDMVSIYLALVPNDLVSSVDVVLIGWEISAKLMHRQWRDAYSNFRILVFDADPQRHGYVHRLRNGANGFILSTSTPQDILSSIRTVMETRWAIPPTALAKLCSEIAEERVRYFDSFFGSAMLTTRQREIFGLVCKDYTNKDIARGLNLAVSTVKNHVHQILKKLEVQRRFDLVRYFPNVHKGNQGINRRNCGL